MMRPSAMSPFTSPESAIVRCWCPRRTGGAFRRRSTFFPSQACVIRSERDLRSLSASQRRPWPGELGTLFHQAGAEGCQEARFVELACTNRAIAGGAEKGSFREASPIRAIAGRFGRCLFEAHQHTASVGLPSVHREEGREGPSDVDALRIRSRPIRPNGRLKGPG